MQSINLLILQTLHILKIFFFLKSAFTSSLIVQNYKSRPFFIAMPEGSEFPGDSANYTSAVPGIVSKAVTRQENGELKTGNFSKQAAHQ